MGKESRRRRRDEEQRAGTRTGASRRAAAHARAQEVHVGIAAVPDTSSGLRAPELDAVKGALLYADRVTLFSAHAVLHSSIDKVFRDPVALMDAARPLIDAETAAQFDQFGSMVPAMLDAHRSGRLDDLASLLDEMGTGQGETVREMVRMLDEFDAKLADGREMTEDLFDKHGYSEIREAARAGILTIHRFDGRSDQGNVASAVAAATGSSNDSTDELVTGYVAAVLDFLSRPNVFPLFDEQTANIADLVAGISGQQVSATARWRHKETTTATGLIGFLPTFPEAKVAELLDVRRDLDVPLEAYRRTMARIAREASAPNTLALGDDRLEAERLWYTQAADAIEEIRTALSDAKVHKHLTRQVADDLHMGFGAGLLCVLDGWKSGFDSPTLTQAAVAGGYAYRQAYLARKAARQQRAAAQANPFYFLHAVDRALGRTT